MKRYSLLVLTVLALSTGLSSPAAAAEELSSVPLYSVAEIVFVGPRQTAAAAPARDVQLTASFRHESGSPEYTVQGFFNGDGQGGSEGDVFIVRFCPTRPGKWTIVDVKSNVRKLAGQHRGDYLTATESKLHGFWMPDDESAGRRWYRRSDGSHQYIIGNTHYTFLTEHGLNGKPTGGNIASDMAANAKFFKKVRFGLQNGRYPHPTEKPWLDDDGRPTDDGNYSHRPNPRWFHQRVDLAVRSAFEHDLIADLILAGPDTPESRTTLKAKHNAGDATPYLRYIAARYGSFPNVWLCLCNEYDIKNPNYTQAEIAELGATIRRFLPYPTPLSVHDGSKIGWSAKFDSLPMWADHQIIQRKIRTIAPAADAIDFVWRGEDGKLPDILLSGAGGTFLLRIPENPEAGNGPITRITTCEQDEQKGIGIGDLDRDGHLDLVLVRSVRSPQVDWWRNPGDGAGEWIRHPIGVTIFGFKDLHVWRNDNGKN